MKNKKKREKKKERKVHGVFIARANLVIDPPYKVDNRIISSGFLPFHLKLLYYPSGFTNNTWITR